MATVNDCPSDLDPEKDLGCACWMAKHRYGGFMGPFAMLGEEKAAAAGGK